MISTAASHQGAIEMIWLLLLGSCHIVRFLIQSMDVSNKKSVQIYIKEILFLLYKSFVKTELLRRFLATKALSL